MLCCRAVHSVQRQILSLFYSKEPEVYQYIYEDVTVIESVSLDRRITRFKMWDAEPKTLSDDDMKDVIENRPEPPWLWVGASYFTDTIDMTSELEPYIVEGNKITLDLLGDKFPCYSYWRYLDAETLEEVEFPSEGITIHATRVETLEKEIKEDEDSE